MAESITGNKAICFMVIHSNHAEGTNFYGYWKEADAKKNIRTDANTEMESLQKEGYSPVLLEDTDGSIEVYVPDTDIYYEWSVVMTEIQ